MTPTTDPNNDLTIFQFLEDDLRALSLAEEAERIQLREILIATAPPTQSGHIRVVTTDQPTDSDIALGIFAADTQIARDQVYAELLASQDTSFAVSRQHAQKLAAAEQKIRLDAEFARKLQEVIDQDENSSEDHDVDSLLGREAIDQIVASDPNHKGKGIGKGKGREPDARDTPESISSEVHVYPICGICQDVFQETHSPVSASLSANSSARLPFGLRLPCPNNHPYCAGCLSKYIISKLDPDGTGGAPDEQIVFPILCPECKSDQWADGIQDSVAERILTKDNLVLWYHRRLLDSLPRYYCPNRQCSARVQLHEEEDEPQATCPLCETIICVPCKTLWHDNLTCEEYQALPLDERSPEDRLLFQLAKDKKWRRCKDCNSFVELVFGCNHITCRCGSHFCFKCGAAWDIKGYRCSAGAGCELWEDDDMLLGEDQRRGGAAAQEGAAREAFAPMINIPRVLELPPPPPPYQEYRVVEDFGWIHDNAVVVRNHQFTGGMIVDTSCGYCGRGLPNLESLRRHLANIRRHPVYSCCGKFFRLRHHYEQHRSALVHHEHTCVRNDDEAEV